MLVYFQQDALGAYHDICWRKRFRSIAEGKRRTRIIFSRILEISRRRMAGTAGCSVSGSKSSGSLAIIFNLSESNSNVKSKIGL